MNRIHTAVAAVAMLIGAATVASAQTPAPQQGQQGGKAQRGAHGMMADLNLTNAQKEQIKAIHAKYRVQFQQLRERSRPDVEAARAARQAGDTAAARAAMARARSQGTAVAALRQQEQAEIRAVLTAEQQTKFDARQAQMRERMAQRDSTHKARPRGAHGRRPARGARPGRSARPDRPAQPRG
ncbi:MAG: Spy/CpxP family protein refolding chaperone [Gemmatimonadaceae bacterium]